MLRRIAIARQLLRMQVTSGCFMRLLDEDADASCNRVTCYLTRAEAQELRDSLEALLRGGMERHEHVSSADFGKEITVFSMTRRTFHFSGNDHVELSKMMHRQTRPLKIAGAIALTIWVLANSVMWYHYAGT